MDRDFYLTDDERRVRAAGIPAVLAWLFGEVEQATEYTSEPRPEAVPQQAAKQAQVVYYQQRRRDDTPDWSRDASAAA